MFDYDIDDLVKLTGMRKNNVKRCMLMYSFKEGVDFTIQKVPSTHPQGGRSSEVIKMSKTCYDQVLTHTKLRKRSICDEEALKIEYVKRFLPEETEIVNFLFDVLSPLFNVVRQYRVLDYRIDLYIVDKRIAIECDENGHSNYDKRKEAIRQAAIESHLDCTFIRFNPNAKDFLLSTLTSSVIKACLFPGAN